jgi:DNA-binding MarR family transcriptional regulator
MVADMQVSLAKSKQIIRAIAPSGNLFLVITLQELRRQGLTFIAFYALQRIIQVPLILQSSLGQETGLEDYEISRACGFLASSGLIEIGRGAKDKRVRTLTPTRRGIQIQDRVLSAAARRLQEGCSSKDGSSCVGEDRRLTEAAEAFREGNRILRGPLQLSFFDTHKAAMTVEATQSKVTRV